MLLVVICDCTSIRLDTGMLSPSSSALKGQPPCLLSLITPCLNADKTISHTLDSVQSVALELSRHGWQLQHLLVDGGSSDNSLEKWHEYEKKQPNCQLLIDVDGGPYQAMQAGLLQAHGIYTHILNADDYIVNPRLYVESLLKANSLSSVVIISSISYFKQFSGQITRLWAVPALPTSFPDWQVQLSHGLHYPHPGFISCTKTYRAVGFDPTYRLSSDYKTMQLILQGLDDLDQVIVVREPLVAMAEGGLTAGLRSVLHGRTEIRRINRELGIKHSSYRRYLPKLFQIFFKHLNSF